MANNPLIDALMQALTPPVSSGGIGGPMVTNSIRAVNSVAQPAAGEIGRILSPTASAMPAPQPQAPAMPALPASLTGQSAPQATEQPSRMGELLRHLGIPLLATGIGLAGGGGPVTAGAAGFNKGYGETVEKEADRKAKSTGRKVFVLNEETGQMEPVGTVGEKDIVRTKDGVSVKADDQLINKLFPGRMPESKTTDQIKQDVTSKNADSGKFARARDTLLAGGRDASEESVSKFLQLNPNF